MTTLVWGCFIKSTFQWSKIILNNTKLRWINVSSSQGTVLPLLDRDIPLLSSFPSFFSTPSEDQSEPLDSINRWFHDTVLIINVNYNVLLLDSLNCMNCINIWWIHWCMIQWNLDLMRKANTIILQHWIGKTWTR